jgi:NAD(P)-dependent dehydrogenase (short-subunit alcohol dehydrogenase family)
MTADEGVVILTGAASGIGRATAEALAAKARPLALVDIDAPKLAEVVATCRKSSARVSGFPCDISDGSLVSRTYAQIRKEYGAPAVLVNCAGVGRFAPFLELAPTEWQRILNINVMGTVFFTHAVLADMIAARSGLIINVSSRMALDGQPNTTAYAASKAAVIGMTRALAAEVAKHGIKVTLLAPGGTKTNIETPKHEGYMEPEAIAEAIVYITENRGAAWVRDLSVLPLGF